MVSLRSAANAHFCGGSIHNSRWILSSAHCTIGRTSANTLSVVGSVRLDDEGITHTTMLIMNHPNYNADTFNNDISLLWTETELIFSETVQPIPLGTTNIGSNVFAVISGWGFTSVSTKRDLLRERESETLNIRPYRSTPDTSPT